MRKIFVLVLCVFLCGCIQSQEHLSFKADGSGELEVHLMVPEGMIAMVDATMGAFVKGMAQALGGGDQMPASVAEEMFASREEINKKAQKAGVNIVFRLFNKDVRDKNLYVDYVIGFDDVNRLLESGIVATNLRLAKDAQGRLVAFLKKDEEKAEESRGQMAQVATEKPGEEETPAEKQLREKFLGALGQFKVEFRLTMPNPIESVSGMFTKEGERTASMSFEGDLLKDKALLDEFYGVRDEESLVVASAEGVTFALPSLADAIKKTGPSASSVSSEPPVPQYPSLEEILGITEAAAVPAAEPKYQKVTLSTIPIGSRVKVTLRDGEVVDGELVERANDYVRIDTGAGLAFTYFTELIWKIEPVAESDVKS